MKSGPFAPGDVFEFDEAYYLKIYNYTDGTRDPAKVEKNVASIRKEFLAVHTIACEKRLTWDAAYALFYEQVEEAEYQAKLLAGYEECGLAAALEDGDGIDFDDLGTLSPPASPLPPLELRYDPKARALALLAEGKTQKEVALALNVHVNTVGNWIKKAKKAPK